MSLFDGLMTKKPWYVTFLEDLNVSLTLLQCFRKYKPDLSLMSSERPAPACSSSFTILWSPPFTASCRMVVPSTDSNVKSI